MKILGKVKKKTVVTETVRPVKKVVCDKCGKELTNLYARVSTSHQLWGNDSHESIEFHDYCFECVKKVFEEYIKDAEITENFEYEVVSADTAKEEEIEVRDDGELFFGERGYKIEEELEK